MLQNADDAYQKSIDEGHKPDENLEVKISCVTEDENFDISKYVSIRSQKVVKSYDAEIILADEPTGNLDSDTQNEIMEIFRSLANDGKCVILVSHSPEVAEKCDEVYKLRRIDGKKNMP